MVLPSRELPWSTAGKFLFGVLPCSFAVCHLWAQKGWNGYCGFRTCLQVTVLLQYLLYIYQGYCCLLQRVFQEQAPPFYGDRTCLRKKQWYRVSPFIFYSLDASKSYTFSLNESRSSSVQLQWYIYYFIVANYQEISLTENTKTFRQKLVPS